jgi:hypothetical protein
MRWTHCVLAAWFAAGMSSAGCDKGSDNNTKYGAGAPVGFASGGSGAGSGGVTAVGSGGATGAAGMGMGPAGMEAPGAGGTGVVTGSGGGTGPVTGSGGMAGAMAAGSGGVPAGSGGMAGGSGGMPAASNEPCPDVDISDFGIMLPGCCDMASNQCGIDGSMFGGTGCTPLAEAAAMAMSMGAPPGTIPDPRACPTM